MKRRSGWLLLALTVLLTAAGAGMPWAAARFQDRYGIAAQEVLPLDVVNLTLRKDSEIGAVLRLMSSPSELTDWTGETNMDQNDVCIAAFDALVKLDQYELLEPCFDRYGEIEPDILDRMKAEQLCETWPQLFTNQDGSSSVVWLCWLTDPAGPQYHLLLDDMTGLAVSGYIPCAYADDTEAFYQRMQRWHDFFDDYYGIEVQDVQDNIYDAMSEFIYQFDLEDGLGPCGMVVSMGGYEMSFGVCGQEDLSSENEDSNVSIWFSELEGWSQDTTLHYGNHQSQSLRPAAVAPFDGEEIMKKP